MQSTRLPFEILEVIAFKHPMAFKLIYQTCRRMTQMNVLQMMDESIEQITNKCGDTMYILPNGDRHRGYDLPAIVFSDGQKELYKNGQRHRDNGPAVIYDDGQQDWYRNGLKHRDDGPASISSDGQQSCLDELVPIYFFVSFTQTRQQKMLPLLLINIITYETLTNSKHADGWY